MSQVNISVVSITAFRFILEILEITLPLLLRKQLLEQARISISFSRSPSVERCLTEARLSLKPPQEVDILVLAYVFSYLACYLLCIFRFLDNVLKFVDAVGYCSLGAGVRGLMLAIVFTHIAYASLENIRNPLRSRDRAGYWRKSPKLTLRPPKP